jgi:hypothetical protein
MSVDGRLRNELSRDASDVDVDVNQYLDDVLIRGRRWRRIRRAGGTVVVGALIAVLAVAGPTVLDAIRSQRDVPADHGPRERPIVDPLVGSWQSTTTPAQLQSLADSRFRDAQNPAWKRELETLYRQNGGVGVNTLQFEGGRLTVELSADGAIPQPQWHGTYEIIDNNTFVAGDNGSFYITYRYQVDGNRLTVHVVEDLFPDDVGLNPPPVPDLLPQVLLWETAPFTKVG